MNTNFCAGKIPEVISEISVFFLLLLLNSFVSYMTLIKNKKMLTKSVLDGKIYSIQILELHEI